MTPIYAVRLVKESMAQYSVARRLVTSKESAELVGELMDGASVEEFWIVALDAKLKIIGTNKMSLGNLTQSLVHPRELFKFLFLTNSASFIIAHNHPSGDSTPSADDDEVTKRVRACAALLAVPMLDHIICGSSGKYYSYADNGWNV